MVRAFKHHEAKLLKKVDFLQWKSENNLREVKVLRKYHIQRREDYTKYNKLCGIIRSLASKISLLDDRDPHKAHTSSALLDKLYRMGLIVTAKGFHQCEAVTASAFCRRRLPVVMVRLKMAENVREAVQLVEQGHVRVGPDAVNDPAFLVTRPMEDFVTWVDTSKIRRHVLKYNDKLDDFDLL
ncbi:hypothetical protein CAOG_03011 [Capsaspora owczarzaki ATCC 30864]|nr:hypothetical protein CAOG_03011 [Capsaspora owczarzaki ATCC 30864]|eukprot:XP_004363850.1 hypothetical protein CAOG_03011 [Capsaspora owczarzaki ATCC 30864]